MGQRCSSRAGLAPCSHTAMGTSGSTDGVICISEIALSEKDAFRTPVSLMSLEGAGNIDWECVYFDKFEDDKLDKACKRPFGPSGLA